MDEVTRNLELMKISANLTLALCILEASPYRYEKGEMAEKVERFFDECMERLQNRQYDISAQKPL